MSIGLIEVVAVSEIAPLASMSAFSPMNAFVVIVTTLTATAAPTAVLPNAPLRARSCIPTGAVAARVMPPGFDVIVTSSPSTRCC